MAYSEEGVSRRNFVILSALAVPFVAESAWSFKMGREIERKRRGNISSSVNIVVLNLHRWEREVSQFQNSLSLPDQSPLTLGAAGFMAGRKLTRRRFLNVAAGETALLAGTTAIGSEIGRDFETNRKIFIENCIDEISEGLNGWISGVKAINPAELEDKRVPVDRNDIRPQPYEQYPPFYLQNEGNFPIPLLDKFKKGKTVFIHLPGAGNERPDGVGSYQSQLRVYEPWIKKYFQAQGFSKEEAAQNFQELENNVMSYRNIELQGPRLGAEVEAMLEMGMLFLPWEMVPDNSPISMALLAAAFIKNLPQGTEVVLTGHSLGALALRSLLKMYQEGLLDQALKGKKLISTISSNEAYPGDVLLNSFFILSEQFNAHPEIGTDVMNLFYQWINRLFIDPDSSPADIRVKYKDELEGIYNLQKAYKESDPLPKLTFYLARRAAYLLGDPYYYSDADAKKVDKRGTRAISIHSLQDLYALNAQIKNAIDVRVHINPDLNGIVDKVTIAVGNTDRLFHFPDDPKWTLSHIGERAHWPFSEVADVTLNTT